MRRDAEFPQFSIVVAMDASQGIGKNGVLPWHLPADLKHFRKITTAGSGHCQNTVIMGRKTWDSLPEKFRPLPDRLNVVLTRNPRFVHVPGVISAGSFERALARLASDPSSKNRGEIFVIGGEQIFREAMLSPGCKKIYATHIRQTFDCDCFFPPFLDRFALTNSSAPCAENSIDFYFAEYARA